MMTKILSVLKEVRIQQHVEFPPIQSDCNKKESTLSFDATKKTKWEGSIEKNAKNTKLHFGNSERIC